MSSFDRSGTAFVDTRYPLQMLVVGRDGGRRAWARLTFQATVPASVPKQPGVRWDHHGGTLTVCVPARGSEPVRSATVSLTAALQPGTPPPAMYPAGMPLEGLQLTAMRAVTGRCSV